MWHICSFSWWYVLHIVLPCKNLSACFVDVTTGTSPVVYQDHKPLYCLHDIFIYATWCAIDSCSSMSRPSIWGKYSMWPMLSSYCAEQSWRQYHSQSGHVTLGELACGRACMCLLGSKCNSHTVSSQIPELQLKLLWNMSNEPHTRES